MPGEKVFFRKKFFGGFNREDVVAYIAQIAAERNNAITEKEMQESEIIRLREALSEKQAVIESYEKLIEKLKKRKSDSPPETTLIADRIPKESEPAPKPDEPVKPKKNVIVISRKK